MVSHAWRSGDSGKCVPRLEPWNENGGHFFSSPSCSRFFFIASKRDVVPPSPEAGGAETDGCAGLDSGFAGSADAGR